MSYSNLSKLNFDITNNFFIASGKIRHTWWGIFSCDLSLIRHRDHIICRKFLKCVYNVLFCLCPWLRLCLCLFCLWAVQRGQTSFRFWWNVSLSEWSGEEKVTSRIEGWNSHGMLVIRQSQQYYCDLIFSFSKLLFLFLSNLKREDWVVWPFHAYCLLFRSSMLVGIALANCSDYLNFSSFFIKLFFCNYVLLWLCCAFNQAALCLLMSGSNASSLCVWTEELHQGPTIWLPPTYMQTKQQNLENIILRILENTRIFLTISRARHMTSNNIYAKEAK